jgi:hypothetical protein
MDKGSSMIYAMGNSHAHFFSNSHPGDLGWGKVRGEHFVSYSANFHHPNPKYRHVLVHKFTERFYPFLVQTINNADLTGNDYIMFIVGEIDCRWHFPKKVQTQNRTIEDVLKEEMEYFFPAFLHLQENGYNVVGWGGHPSTVQGHNDDPDNPVYGDCFTRNKISLLWNDMLEERCRKNNMKFVSVIRDLINPDGLTKKEYMFDYCHLNWTPYEPNIFPLVVERCKDEGMI